jgi:hypothetical protein
MKQQLSPLALGLVLVSLGFSQTAHKPNLPNIPSKELIAWTQQQAPQPVDGQYDPQKRPAAQTFAGMIVKSGEKYVLSTSDNVIYDLDDQERAQTFEGKQVQVVGILDKASNTIKVQQIKAAV